MCLTFILIWGVIQQSVYETNIQHIDDLQKRLMQTCLTLIGTSSMLPDHLRSCVHAGGGHFEHTL